MSEFVVLVEHSVKYTNKQPLAVQDVIDSLAALEKISIYFLPEALTQLTGAGVMSAELLIEGFQHGSFIEDTLIKLAFKNKEEMDKFLDKVREGGRNVYRQLPGNGAPVLKGAIVVTCVVGALVVAGAGWAILNKAPSPVTLNITNSNFVVIGAESYAVSPQQFADVITGVGATDKKKLAQAAVKVIAPAKSEDGAIVVMSDDERLSIPVETIRKAPSTVEFEAFEVDEPHPDADVEIRATDLDSSNKGWAAIIRGLVDRRVKLILDDGVNPQSLAGKFKVRADVSVKYRMSGKTKKMEPVSITIQKIIED